MNIHNRYDQLKMRQILIIIITASLLSCNQGPIESPSVSFEKDLEALKEYFHIPGMAAIITQKGKIIYENYSGYADLKTNRLVDSTTVFPINSITKTYAAVLFMQLVEAGELDLNESINHYLHHSHLSDAIKIKHVLSHTSEATPGSFYNYTGYRYHLLAEVLEQVSGKPYDVLMQEKILNPLGLSDTFLPFSHASLDSLTKNRIAKPYTYSGKIEDGRYEAYKSAATGLVATARDIAKFDNALNSGKLISDKSKREMFSPFPTSNGNSPYGYGIFSQAFLGKQLIWGYGQGEYSSSLLLKVPEDEFTLILQANNNQMSDPARLLNGDITYSLFALSFLKHFVFDLPQKLDWSHLNNQEELAIAITQKKYGPFYRQELLANAIAAVFTGFTYSDSVEISRSKDLAGFALENFPDYKNYGDQPLMFLLSNLSIHANFNEVDKIVENLGERLLEENPLDPYTNLYLGNYYNHKNKKAQALEYYKRIADVDNYNPRAWFWVVALDLVGEYYKQENPELAKRYFQKIVDIGWNLRGLLDKAKNELKDL